MRPPKRSLRRDRTWPAVTSASLRTEWFCSVSPITDMRSGLATNPPVHSMARAMSSTESAIWTSLRRDRELHANDRTTTSVADGLFPERLPSHGWSGRPGSSGRKRETLGDEANRLGVRPRGEKIAPRIRLLDGWSWPVGVLRDAFCRPPPIEIESTTIIATGSVDRIILG